MNTRTESTVKSKEKLSSRDTERFRQTVAEIKSDHGPNGRRPYHLPKILHPEGQLESFVHRKIGEISHANNAWFVRTGGEIVMIHRVPSGFEFSKTRSLGIR